MRQHSTIIANKIISFQDKEENFYIRRVKLVEQCLKFLKSQICVTDQEVLIVHIIKKKN